MSLRNYTNAIKCYQLQLERAKELRDNAIEAEAFGNLGIIQKMKMYYYLFEKYWNICVIKVLQE